MTHFQQWLLPTWGEVTGGYFIWNVKSCSSCAFPEGGVGGWKGAPIPAWALFCLLCAFCEFQFWNLRMS